jgi:hypothetical protein
MDTSALVKIDNVVYSFLNEKDEGLENFLRYKQIVIEGFTQEFSVKNGEGVKVYYGTVDAVNNFFIPSDCINISRAGIISNGQIHTFVKNDNLAMPDGLVCGVEVVNSDLLRGLTPPQGFNYAKGGGYDIGEYRVDMRNRVIRFRGNLAGQIMALEYRSSGISLEGESYIPVTIIPALKEYLEWVLLKRNLDSNLGRVQMAHRNYVNAKKRYILTKNSFSMRELLDAINRGKSQGVK